MRRKVTQETLGLFMQQFASAVHSPGKPALLRYPAISPTQFKEKLDAFLEKKLGHGNR